MLIHDLNERKWKTLKSEYLIRRPWLTARRDTVELPGGSVNPEFYVLEYPDWVNVLAITSDDEFVYAECQSVSSSQGCLYARC